MKAEYRQEGETLNYTNPTIATIPAGTVIVLGTKCGIASTEILPGETGSISMCGVWLMEKDNTAITGGGTVYYDTENDTATATVKGEGADDDNTILGYATAEAATDDKYVLVSING